MSRKKKEIEMEVEVVLLKDKKEEKEEGEKMMKVNKSAEIRRLYLEGMDLKEISQEVGVRYNMVYNVVLNLCLKEGVEMRVKSKRDGVKERVIDLLKSGMNIKDVCIEVGCVYNYVWKIKKEMEMIK